MCVHTYENIPRHIWLCIFHGMPLSLIDLKCTLMAFYLEKLLSSENFLWNAQDSCCPLLAIKWHEISESLSTYVFFFFLWKREKLQACIETLGDVICYHHGMTSSEQPESSLIHHRMVFMGTGIFTIRLLQTLLPVEKVSEHMAVPFLDINKPCHHRWMDIWPCPSWSLLKQMRVWNTPEVAVKGSIVQLSCRPKDSTVIIDKFISVCACLVYICVFITLCMMSLQTGWR